jgi:hypothetical protein
MVSYACSACNRIDPLSIHLFLLLGHRHL